MALVQVTHLLESEGDLRAWTLWEPEEPWDMTVDG